MNIADALRSSTRRLADAGLDDPRGEATALLLFATARDRTFLIAHPEYELSSDERTRLADIVERRASRIPFAYITGTREFYGREFTVTPDVLIPRPETEILVETAVNFLVPLDSPIFCEVGVGSGCISVSVLAEVVAATGFASDISAAAINVAEANARTHGVAGRLEIRHAPFFDAFAGKKFDAILSNPPYIPGREIRELMADVRDHEPLTALSGGGSGFDAIEAIAAAGRHFLRTGGVLLMEIGHDQYDETRRLLLASGWSDVSAIRDLQGIDRIVRAVAE